MVGVLASLAAVGLPAPAAASVTSVTSCQGLTTPGTYRLDADLSPPTFKFCFTIAASNVTLNLNGHTLTGLGNQTAISAESSGTNADIRGPGTITGFQHIGIQLGSGGRVTGVTLTHNGLGIDVAGSGSSVKGNVATDNDSGITVVLGATGNTIIGNFAHNNTSEDLNDDNACGSNVWMGNDFGTANLSCIH
jgi:parallel beta-helix repeat protein